jgi:exoribonuclease-2
MCNSLAVPLPPLSPKALAAAPPADPDAATRRDLTHLAVFTIDDAGTTEVDDGLSVEPLPGGGLRLWVHVADPTRWVEPGSAVDRAARERTRTLYLPFGSVPMFPDCLAEGAFSLRSGGGDDADAAPVCCALSLSATLGSDGALKDYEFTPSLVRVTNSVTYDEADADLALGPEGCRYPELQQLFELARLRKSWRAARGAIDIDVPEPKTVVPRDSLSAAAPPVTITKISQWESAGRVLVAEMMILAGEAAGDYGRRSGLPLPFRGQETPDLPPPEVLDGLPDGPCRGYALRRCMTRSVMGPEPVAHASLALDAYVQVGGLVGGGRDWVVEWLACLCGVELDKSKVEPQPADVNKTLQPLFNLTSKHQSNLL